MPFVLVAAQLFHSVLDSILMFTGLLGGRATYTWPSWALALGWSALGNVIGGVGLVTSIRLLRVPHRVKEERASGQVADLSSIPQRSIHDQRARRTRPTRQPRIARG